MKTVDIKPGTMVAVTDRQNSVIAEGVRDGKSAMPAKVIAVGKFRWRQEGACARSVADDYHTNMVHVSMLDIDASYPERSARQGVLPSVWRNRALTAGPKFPGFPEGPKLTSKKLVWKEELLPMNAVMYPWEHFLRLREERLLVELEVGGYQRRLEDITAKLSDLLLQAVADGKARTSVMSNSVAVGENLLHARMNVAIDLVNINPALAADVLPLVTEHRDLTRRISCSR